ncbi:hypothetical protein PAMA_020471 [Pampus argenteus]
MSRKWYQCIEECSHPQPQTPALDPSFLLMDNKSPEKGGGIVWEARSQSSELLLHGKPPFLAAFSSP